MLVTVGTLLEVSIWVEVLTCIELVLDTPQAPITDGTAFVPFVIATTFVPQSAAWARRTFLLSWSYTTYADLIKVSALHQHLSSKLEGQEM